MEERKNFNCERIGVCSKCGKISPIEIHHKIPLAIGGTNDNDNLICLCEKCHKEVHKSNRSECIKAGMHKERECDLLISYYDIAAMFYDLIVDANGHIHVKDILDILDSVDIKRMDSKLAHIHERIDNYSEKVDKINEWIGAGTA